MKKYLIYKGLCLLNMGLFHSPKAVITLKSGVRHSLKTLSTKSLFNLLESSEYKQDFNELICQENMTVCFSFKDLIIDDLDLSNMYLVDLSFENCKFIKIKFNDSDLRKTKFYDCEFKETDLTNAILHCHLPYSTEEARKIGLKISNWDPYHLVKTYKNLVTDFDSSQFKSQNEKAWIRKKSSQCLNQFFSGLNLNLHKQYLKGFTLIEINFKNANLSHAQLQGADLTGANLQNTNLIGVQLQRADLTEANLSGAQLSDVYWLPDNCNDEDLSRLYRECNDQKAKEILKIILECKRIFVE